MALHKSHAHEEYWKIFAMAQLSEIGARGKREWLSRVKKTFQNGPLVSNVVFATVLVCLERLVETEFTCPCDPAWNTLFVAAYFIFPGLIASILMLSMQGCRFKDCDRNCCSSPGLKCIKGTFRCFTPAIVWLILLLFDGHYFACAKTDWSGRYVTVDKAAPEKWCEPTNSSSSRALMIQTQQWFVASQGYGFAVVIIAILGVILYGILKRKKKKQSLVSEEEVPGSLPTHHMEQPYQ